MKQLNKFFKNSNSKNTVLYLVLLIVCSSFSNAKIVKQADKDQANALPVINTNKKSISLSAKLDNGSKVVLKWLAPTEIAVSNFVIQRSEDGVNYNDAAVIFAPEEGESTIKRYNYSDKINSAGSETIYYRVKIVDVNGKCTYTDVAVVELNLRDNQFATL